MKKVVIGDCTLICGDCLEVLPTLEAASVDMICADPPYGTTACKWDSIIPLKPLWACLERVIKPRAAVVMTASQPFTTDLINSNREQFKYEIILLKNRPSDKFNARNKPMKGHENILVFSEGTTANCSPRKMNYFPQGLTTCNRLVLGTTGKRHHGTRPSRKEKYLLEWTGYPTSVVYFSKDDAETVHPTQKPVALMEYLIRTYTNEGDTVLDFCFGSGTTGIACQRTGRKFFGCEKDPGYFDIAVKRIEKEYTEQQHTLFQTA